MERRRLGLEDQEQSYLISMSDLMASLVFIFIIAVTVFAILLKEAEQEQMQEVKRLQSVDEKRDALLAQLRTRLAEEGVSVEVDFEHGILRLPEEVLFESGYDRFVAGGEDKLERLATVLTEVIPPYTWMGDSLVPDVTLDALMIEGHTDSRRVLPGTGRSQDNWELSAFRAIRTYEVLTRTQPLLQDLRNTAESPILGVAGYAASRPVDDGDSEEAFARNRRIDLRFLMSPPIGEERKPLMDSR